MSDYFTTPSGERIYVDEEEAMPDLDPKGLEAAKRRVRSIELTGGGVIGLPRPLPSGMADYITEAAIRAYEAHRKAREGDVVTVKIEGVDGPVAAPCCIDGCQYEKLMEAHKASEGYRWVKFKTGSPPPFQYDDEKGLEAAERAVTALVESGNDYSDSDLAVTAIRAYEAHKAAEVKDPENPEWTEEDFRRAMSIPSHLRKRLGDYTEQDMVDLQAAREAHKASAACDGDPNNHCPTCGLNSMTIKATLAEYHKASAVLDGLPWRCKAGVCDHDDHLPRSFEYGERDIPSAVPDEVPLSDPRHPESISSFLPSVVPDEVREVVMELRNACTDFSGEQIADDSTTVFEMHCGLLRRAADLLEQMALGQKAQEKHRDALKQLADHGNTPPRRSPDTALEGEGDHHGRK